MFQGFVISLFSSGPKTKKPKKRRNHFLKDRLNLFEFGDQPWLCGDLREAYVNCLNFLFRVGGHYHRMHQPFLKWVHACRCNTVLDLASGGAGPIQILLKSIQKIGEKSPQIILSDLYPNLKTYEALKKEFGSTVVDYVSDPVSVDNIRGDFKCRTICSSLHHFSNEYVRSMIEDVLTHGSGIFILEPFQRNLKHLLMAVFTGPFLAMLTPFFRRKFSFKEFLVCTVFPIAPVMVWFDGIMSVLRSYTSEEIKNLLPATGSKDYKIEFGTKRYLVFFDSMYFSVVRLDHVSQEVGAT
jgi:hypothetical protein